MQLTVNRPESVKFQVQRQIILRGMEGTQSTEMILFWDPDKPSQEHLGLVQTGEGRLQRAMDDIVSQGLQIIYAGPILHYIETEAIAPVNPDDLPEKARVFRNRLTDEYYKRTPRLNESHRTQYHELASMFDGEREDWLHILPDDFDADEWEFIELDAGENAYTIEFDLRQMRMLTNVLRNVRPDDDMPPHLMREAHNLAEMLHWAMYHLTPQVTFRVQSAQNSESDE